MNVEGAAIQESTTNALLGKSGCITFDHTEVNPGETLYISVPKLNENKVIVPGSLALIFNLNVSGDANNFLVQNVWQALVDKFVVKLSGNILQDTAI